MRLTAVPQVEFSLLYPQEQQTSTRAQAGTTDLHFNQRALHFYLSTHTEQTPVSWQEKHTEITHKQGITASYKRGLVSFAQCFLCLSPVLLKLSSLEPRWIISPPWKSWRKQGGSLPCVTSTCAPLWLPSSTVMRADVPRPLTLEWRPCQKKHAVRSLPGPAVLTSPGFCLLPTANTYDEILSTSSHFFWIMPLSVDTSAWVWTECDNNSPPAGLFYKQEY